MVIDSNGVPLMTRAERKTEWLRCLQVIGWSQQKFADRTGVKLHTVLAIKSGNRDLPDSDLRWVQQLAAAVAALPRPPIEDDPVPADHPVARLEPAARVEEVTMQTIAAHQAAMPTTAIEIAVPAVFGPAEVLRELEAVYRDAGASEGATDDQAAGARWAVGALAQRLGLLEALQAMIAAPPVSQLRVAAPQPDAAVARTPEPQAWQPPPPIANLMAGQAYTQREALEQGEEVPF